MGDGQRRAAGLEKDLADPNGHQPDLLYSEDYVAM
jgi:hypothetical protein